MILHILGKMMGVEGLLLLIPALVGLIYQENVRFILLLRPRCWQLFSC